MKKRGRSLKAQGGATVEMAFTLPIVLYLLFFVIEILRMKDAQTAVDSIAEECAIQFMSSKSTTTSLSLPYPLDFSAIIEKYRPRYMSKDNITYYFTIFESPQALYNNMTNIAVYWPASESAATAKEQLNNSGETKVSGTLDLKNYKNVEQQDNNVLSGGYLTKKAFVLTVVIKYKFSSGMVKMLFGGGSNTSGDVFLVWSRATGICR